MDSHMLNFKSRRPTNHYVASWKIGISIVELRVGADQHHVRMKRALTFCGAIKYRLGLSGPFPRNGFWVASDVLVLVVHESA